MLSDNLLNNKPFKMSSQLMTINGTVSSLDNLPFEILTTILGHLSIIDRFNIRQLNRKWRQISLTGITHLLVGNDHFGNNFWTINQFPDYKIDTTDSWNSCKIFELVMKEGGHFLKNLIIDHDCKLTSSDEDQRNSAKRWIQVIRKIPNYCPNITGLCVHLDNNRLNRLTFVLLRHYSQQLESVCLQYWHASLNMCTIAVQQFNVKRLRTLSLPSINQINLEMIANAFPLLCRLEFEKKANENEIDRYDFKCLQKMTQLNDLKFGFQLSNYSFRSLMTSPVARKLEKIELILGQFPSLSYKLLRNLVSLTSLAIISNPCETFFIGLSQLKLLRNLNILLHVEECNLKRVKDGLKLIQQLIHLKSLTIYLQFLNEIINFSFAYFPPITSLLDLELTFLKSDHQQTRDNQNQLCVHIEHVPKIFPNLIHFSVVCEYSLDDSLVECVDNLTCLQSFSFAGKSCHDAQQLKNLCAKKHINFELNLI